MIHYKIVVLKKMFHNNLMAKCDKLTKTELSHRNVVG